jgi:hypothetical protein
MQVATGIYGEILPENEINIKQYTQYKIVNTNETKTVPWSNSTSESICIFAKGLPFPINILT